MLRSISVDSLSSGAQHDNGWVLYWNQGQIRQGEEIVGLVSWNPAFAGMGGGQGEIIMTNTGEEACATSLRQRLWR